LPLAGIANKLVVLCNETGRFVIYRADAHGFNNPQSLWPNVPTDIVVVGDSFAHGYCVDASAVTVIRRRYPATLNLGIEGNGPLTMLGVIKEYARFLKPKVLLWFHFEGNDLVDLSRERRSPLLRRYLTKGFSQNLLAQQPEIDRALTDYLETLKDKSDLSVRLEEIWAQLGDLGRLRKRTRSIVKLAQVRTRLGLVYAKPVVSNSPGAAQGSGREEDGSQMRLLYDILVEAKRSVEEWGGHVTFVYLPAWNRYASTVAPRERDDVLLTAGRAGLPVLDLHQAFISYQDPLALFPFRLPGHYTEEGNRLVAEKILESISIAAPRKPSSMPNRGAARNAGTEP
jgi:hypothetical protein